MRTAPSVPVDVAESAGSGLVRGATEFAMSPATLPKMAADAIVSGGEWLTRKALGLGPITPETQAARDQAQRDITARSIVPAPDQVVGAVRAAEDATLHAPQTIAGKYAESIGEMVPAALAGPGGLARKGAEMLLPGLASEAADEWTKGASPYARAAGGLVGNAIPALLAGRASAPANAIVRATEGVSPAEFQAAQELQTRAAALGVPLTGPEAVQAATQGATKIGDLMRVVEGSSGGGTTTSRFFAARPDQVATAAGRTFDAIAAAPSNPSSIGPRAAQAAQGSLDDTRRGINTATAPAYRAAEGHEIDPADFAPIGDDPAFQHSLARLRNDPVLGPAYAHLPDNAVGVVDAVTKDMQAQGTAATNAANPGFNPQRAAAYGTGAAEARDIARDPARGGSQAYDDALTAQQQARAQNLNPLEQGPLGRVAAATDTRGAYGALLPAQPLAGSQGEVADTVARLAARDPQVANELIRQHLADGFDQAAQRNIGGPNQWGGAKFARAVAGSDQQGANLNAALGALPSSGGPLAPVNRVGELLDALRATGWRKAQGSPTAFNQQIQGDMSAASLPMEAAKAVVTGGLSLPLLYGKLKEAGARGMLAGNTGRLADLFVAPDSASQIAALAARGAQSPLVAMFARQGVQTPGELRTR